MRGLTVCHKMMAHAAQLEHWGSVMRGRPCANSLGSQVIQPFSDGVVPTLPLQRAFAPVKVWWIQRD